MLKNRPAYLATASGLTILDIAFCMHVTDRALLLLTWLMKLVWQSNICDSVSHA